MSSRDTNLSALLGKALPGSPGSAWLAGCVKMRVACHDAHQTNFWTATSFAGAAIPIVTARLDGPRHMFGRVPLALLSLLPPVHAPARACRSIISSPRDCYRADVTKITCPDLSGSAATPKACAIGDVLDCINQSQL